MMITNIHCYYNIRIHDDDDDDDDDDDIVIIIFKSIIHRHIINTILYRMLWNIRQKINSSLFCDDDDEDDEDELECEIIKIKINNATIKFRNNFILFINSILFKLCKL